MCCSKLLAVLFHTVQTQITFRRVHTAQELHPGQAWWLLLLCTSSMLLVLSISREQQMVNVTQHSSDTTLSASKERQYSAPHFLGKAKKQVLTPNKSIQYIFVAQNITMKGDVNQF